MHYASMGQVKSIKIHSIHVLLHKTQFFPKKYIDSIPKTAWQRQSCAAELIKRDSTVPLKMRSCPFCFRVDHFEAYQRK